MKNIIHTPRQLLTHAKRIVVKLGTHVLVDDVGHPHKRRILSIVKQLATLHQQGKEIVLVSSGAIGAGLAVLNMKRRPTAINDLQMAAAVGQSFLIELYNRYFCKYDCIISQVLLTHADLKHRGRHLNARNTMLNLLHHRIIPIVNENDVVAVDEIRLGDNDVLSSLVTNLIDADLLIMLTTPNGVQQPTENGDSERIPLISKVTHNTLALATGKRNTLSTGGMKTKLLAAKMANQIGAQVVIASGHMPNVITKVTQGCDVGTLIGFEEKPMKLSKRKRWVGYFHHTQGSVCVDLGAEQALVEKCKSLLPAGITHVTGKFCAGSHVQILSQNGELIGCGLVEYASQDIERIKGSKSSDITTILGIKGPDVVIHRDNLMIEKA